MAKVQRGKQPKAKKKATSAGGRKRTTAATKTKGTPQKKATAQTLTFRPREKTDDAFIIEVTMQTLKEVYQQSVGMELREDLVLEWTNQGDYTGIIERGGKPVGYYSYLEHVPNRWYIGALVLTPDMQGQGIGQQIFAHIEQSAREQRIYMLEAHVQVENEAGLAFWTKQGFEKEGQPTRGSQLIRKTLEAR